MRRKPRVHGPYRHGLGFRCTFRLQGQTRATETVKTLDEAKNLKRALVRELEQLESLKIRSALEQYEKFLLHTRGNKPASVKATLWRLREFFPDLDMALTTLTHRDCAAIYQRLVEEPRAATGKPLAPDSHRNYLAEAKSFLKWCVEKELLSKNPLLNVSGQGRRRRGKMQLGCAFRRNGPLIPA